MPSTRQPNRAEYEPLNPTATDSTSDLSWEEKESSSSSSAAATTCCGAASGAAALLSPRAFWALCTVALLTVLNLALYPRTLATSAAHYAPTGLPTIGSSPGLDRARAQGGLASFRFVKPTRIGSADAQDAQDGRAAEGMWAKGRALRVSRRETALVQFTVPDGNASAPCAIAFFRPPLTVTSELTGALAAVEVWDVPAAALSSSPSSSAPGAGAGADGDDGDAPLSLARAQERMVATLDLTRQAALATSGEFACEAGERRVFEVRCPAGKACVVKYTDKPKLNIGFQLRRKI